MPLNVRNTDSPLSPRGTKLSRKAHPKESVSCPKSELRLTPEGRRQAGYPMDQVVPGPPSNSLKPVSKLVGPYQATVSSKFLLANKLPMGRTWVPHASSEEKTVTDARKPKAIAVSTPLTYESSGLSEEDRRQPSNL